MKMLSIKNLINEFETVRKHIAYLKHYLTRGSAQLVNVGINPYGFMRFDAANNQNDEYLTVAQLSQRYPAFTQGSIRWLIFNSSTNGFNKVIRRIGRKVVLSLSAWKAFLEEKI